MKNKNLSWAAMVLSIVAVVLAIVDALGVSVWLAASTWLLIAVVFGVWALFCKE